MDRDQDRTGIPIGEAVFFAVLTFLLFGGFYFFIAGQKVRTDYQDYVVAAWFSVAISIGFSLIPASHKLPVAGLTRWQFVSVSCILFLSALLYRPFERLLALWTQRVACWPDQQEVACWSDMFINPVSVLLLCVSPLAYAALCGRDQETSRAFKTALFVYSISFYPLLVLHLASGTASDQIAGSPGV